VPKILFVETTDPDRMLKALYMWADPLTSTAAVLGVPNFRHPPRKEGTLNQACLVTIFDEALRGGQVAQVSPAGSQRSLDSPC
jgi:hypothetical protein